MASFDVMVAPGELETFCQTIQEAMASEVPVIAPARGGPLDLVVDSSHTGWLYTPKDRAAMRGHVTDLLGDEAKRRAFGVAGRHQVQSRAAGRACAHSSSDTTRGRSRTRTRRYWAAASPCRQVPMSRIPQASETDQRRARTLASTAHAYT
ncbi:glycosyltransferase [Brevibacterium sp. UCMA 11752]|uniref:glycosyltransferase n=1 Tax=Brevibacterium sp. UCMA 11752 TaxID=2745946 RepID=UPI003FA46F49